MWQFIGTTARNHEVPMRSGYEGRLSPVDSTQAAVRYLKTLHGMFGGDWRLAVMGYNAGEYRILQSLSLIHIWWREYAAGTGRSRSSNPCPVR